ncbi:amino acid permease [Vallicoccus soli]|uniref:amino acid permease n=1 Tax=Vallicoccus soli TaxID=2339232 RepID=UPI001C498C31|nr:amino acid permease [Vallicoccus soli]
MTARSRGVFRTKSVEQTLRDTDEPGRRLHRTLKARHLMAFGVGIVIGTGIFTLTGQQAATNAGPAVVVSFLVAGLVSALAALCYAELASTVPAAGSAYTYSYATLGELVAWIIGWDLVLEFALGAAVVARGWSSYLAGLFDLPPELFTEEAPVNVGAIVVVLALGVVAAVGIRESARLTSLLVVVKVAVCVFVIVLGALYVKASNLTPFVPESRPAEAASGLDRPLVQAVLGIDPVAFGIGGVLAAAAVVFFAYTGFEAVSGLAEETEDPQRDLPRGLLGTLALCTLLYVGVALVITGMVPFTDLDTGSPLADAFRLVGAGWAADLIAVAAVAGLTSVILVDIVTMARIGFAMSRDGLLPRAVGAVHPRWGTPFALTLGITGFVALLAGFVPLGALAEMVSIGTLFAFLLVSVGVVVLRRTRPDLHRSFRVPLSPWLPAVSALACVWLMTNLAVATWLRFLVWLVLGLAVYVLYGRTRSRLAQAEATAAPTP